MEITLEAIISFLGLFIGGGGGAFFTWHYLRRKAKAEAVTAEIDERKTCRTYTSRCCRTPRRSEDRKKQIEELRSEARPLQDERNELRQDGRPQHARSWAAHRRRQRP